MTGSSARRRALAHDAPADAPAADIPAYQGPAPANAGRLWLAVQLPGLPLEALYRGHPRDDAGRARAAVNGAAARPVVVAVCERAAAAGVRAGLSASAACALVPDLDVVWRDETIESAALEGLAAWCGQFTSCVSLVPPCGLLLEVGGSVRLFGGLDRLRRRIETGVAGLGYAPATAVAPTALGAWLLALAGSREAVLEFSALPARLAPVAVSCLTLPARSLATLEGMGLHTFGDCARLPRDGLARRLGPVLLDQIDRALGRRPDPRSPHTIPPTFNRRLSLPDHAANVETVLFAAARLLDELEGFLRARGCAVNRLEVHCAHRALPATRLVLGLVEARHDAAYLHEMLRERLQRVMFPAPVEYVALRSTDIVPMVIREADLFTPRGPGGAPPGDWRTLVERLQARLSTHAVSGVAPAPDHRPERAWREVPPGTTVAGPGRSARAAVRGAARSSTRLPAPTGRGAVTPDPAPQAVTGAAWRDGPVSAAATRPLWLLEPPTALGVREQRPCHGSRVLEPIAGPERIESGWWDEYPVTRDYYVAVAAGGQRYWIYRDRRAAGRWFLHGIFA